MERVVKTFEEFHSIDESGIADAIQDGIDAYYATKSSSKKAKTTKEIANFVEHTPIEVDKILMKSNVDDAMEALMEESVSEGYLPIDNKAMAWEELDKGVIGLLKMVGMTKKNALDISGNDSVVMVKYDKDYIELDKLVKLVKSPFMVLKIVAGRIWLTFKVK